MFFFFIPHGYVFYGGHYFVSAEVSCFNDRLIPQSHNMLVFWFSHCKILDHANVSYIVCFELSKFYIQVVGVVFGGKEKFNTVSTFSKVHRVGTREFFDVSSGLLRHGFWSLRWNPGDWKKPFIFESKNKNCRSCKKLLKKLLDSLSNPCLLMFAYKVFFYFCGHWDNTLPYIAPPFSFGILEQI